MTNDEVQAITRETKERTRQEFAGCANEIGANRSLNPTSDYSRGFNDGMTEAIRFIRKYVKGEGLFSED